MRRRRSHAALVAVMAGLAVLLAACGPGAGPGPDESAGAASAADAAAGRAAGRRPTAPPSIDRLLAGHRPLNIAHAGGDQAHPHSTPFAYAEAVRDGADVLELDVQLTADGVLVVHHDETVDRTTEATGPVVGRTLAELQALDAAHWWSRCWACRDRPAADYVYRGIRTGAVPPPAGYDPDDFAVPTFRQIAERFPELPFDIEMKGGQHVDPLEVARVLADELVALDRVASSVVVSFDSAVVQAFHALAPDVAVSPGLQEVAAWLQAGHALPDHYRVLQVPPSMGGVPVLSRALVERAHAEGLDVWVWAADAAEEQARTYRDWLALGVDGVIAGRPAEMTAARCTATPTDVGAAAARRGSDRHAGDRGHDRRGDDRGCAARR
jgi:glycerophosphoryl diester phosphodiesterase